MKSNIIPLLCLLLRTVIANKIKGGTLIRWIGNDNQYSNYFESISQDKGDIIYYDVDLYPYQHFLAQCPTLGKGRPGILSPLDKGRYYTAVSSDGSPSNLKMSRETRKMEDVFPELKVISTEEDHVFYYTAPGKRKKIETIYFECIISIAVPDVTAIIQLNIMPEEEHIPKKQRIILDEVPVLKGKNFTYFKFARPGVENITECKNSDLIVNQGTDAVSLSRGPETDTHINLATMVEYQDVSDYVTKHQATENTHIIDLMDGNTMTTKSVKIYCKKAKGNKLIYMSPYMDDIPGLNVFAKNSIDALHAGESAKIIQIKTEKDSVISVDIPTDGGLIRPIDCLDEVIIGKAKMVKLAKIVRNPKLARLTDSFKILDLSTSSSYREITVSCYVNRPRRGQKNVWMNIAISPLCNFYDPQALDSDGKTCTVFASSHVDSLVATPMDSLESPETFELEEAFFTRSDDSQGTCKDCYYQKIGEQDDGISISINKNTTNQKIKITDGVIKHNPVYILRKEEVKGGNEVLNPTRIIRMYLYNHETSIDEHGKVTVEKDHQVKKSGGKSLFYAVKPSDGRVKISCKDFFEDHLSLKPTLFPTGKNTIFENVSDGSVDPRTIKTIQFEQDFASMGISILKKPETDVDLHITFSEDKLVQNDHVKPIYFICSTDSQGDWEKDKKPYAVIAIDPEYKNEKLQGCGVKSGVFVDENGKTVNDTHCTYNVYKNDIVGFHCPSYVPEHFLEGDQSKHKAAEDAEAENPYQLLLRCYDRSSVSQKMFKPKTDLELFSRPKFAGELRSLWIFDKELLAGREDINNILCVCGDKTGRVVSSINIINETKKENKTST